MRKIAYECLIEVICKDGYANLLMRQKLKNQNSEVKGFVTDVVYGTLRNFMLLRYQWQTMITRKVDEKIAILIDMTLYQIFFTKHAEYAVVNESVALAKERYGVKVAGFVNRILRKCCDQGLIYSDDLDEIKRLSIECSIPEWILKLWRAHYGNEEMENIARDSLHQAESAARVNTLVTTVDEVLKNNAFKKGNLSPLAVLCKGNVLLSDEFKNGKIVIQDEGSQMIAYMMNLEKGMNVLDACSAPGTKTTMMAALMNNVGHILATDLYVHRLKLVEEGAKAAKVTIVETKEMDACRAHEILKGKSFDRILLDVPCSGLGVLKRKPDIKLRINMESLDEIILLQRNILESCTQLLKKGGIFVYSTCTLNKKENERQIQDFLKRHPEFELLQEQTIFPTNYKSDGFYMAQCKKIM